jgi:hypothetical protein
LRPAGTMAQSPRALGRLHAMQVAAQAELQHRPSTQKPLEHSASQLHASALPLDRSTAPVGQSPIGTSA